MSDAYALAALLAQYQQQPVYQYIIPQLPQFIPLPFLAPTSLQYAGSNVFFPLPTIPTFEAATWTVPAMQLVAKSSPPPLLTIPPPAPYQMPLTTPQQTSSSSLFVESSSSSTGPPTLMNLHLPHQLASHYQPPLPPPRARNAWTSADYQIVIEAARRGEDPVQAGSSIGMPACTVRSVLDKNRRDPSHVGPRPRGGAHNVIHDKVVIVEALRNFLARPENGDATVGDMAAHVEAILGTAPSKSTIGEWLINGLIVFPPVNAETSINPALNSTTPVDGGANLILYIAEVSVHLWTKRARGPTGRTHSTPITAVFVYVVAALDGEGKLVLAQTSLSILPTDSFASFVHRSISDHAAKSTLPPTSIRVAGVYRQLYAPHAEALVAMPEYTHANVPDRVDEAVKMLIVAVVDGVRPRVGMLATELRDAVDGVLNGGNSATN